MPANLEIDDKLLSEAVRLGSRRTKRAAVNEALHEYIARRKRLKTLDLFGKIGLDPNYNYKKARQTR